MSICDNTEKTSKYHALEIARKKFYRQLAEAIKDLSQPAEKVLKYLSDPECKRSPFSQLSNSDWIALKAAYDIIYRIERVEYEKLINKNPPPVDEPKDDYGPRDEQEDILAEARRLTSGSRNHTYGHPFDDFTRTALMWTAILSTPVTAEDVALCMIALKISRATHDLNLRDNWVDIAGYARCGWLCNQVSQQDTEKQ